MSRFPKVGTFFSQSLPEVAKRESERAHGDMGRENKEAGCQVGQAVATENVPLLFPQ